MFVEPNDQTMNLSAARRPYVETCTQILLSAWAHSAIAWLGPPTHTQAQHCETLRVLRGSRFELRVGEVTGERSDVLSGTSHLLNLKAGGSARHELTLLKQC